MKKYVLTILALVLLAGTSCQKKVDIEKEKEAILALITEETQAYHDKDYERFAACYVQDENNIRILGGENEKMSYTIGYEKVGSSFKELFESTTVVIFSLVLLTIFIWAIDLLSQWLIRFFILS